MRRILSVIDAAASDSIDRGRTAKVPCSEFEYAMAENAIGTGFVVLQTYMSTIFGILSYKKNRALKLGPRLTPTLSIAEAVNRCANAWKHGNEEMFSNECKARVQVTEILSGLGRGYSKRPLLDALEVICGSHECSLVQALERVDEWRMAVYEDDPRTRQLIEGVRAGT